MPKRAGKPTAFGPDGDRRLHQDDTYRPWTHSHLDANLAPMSKHSQSSILVRFGSRVRELRLEAGLTQEALATLVDSTAPTWRN
ncbi:MAG: helix-turn-helix transcriptional regulator [Pirellulaceae bacterium]